MARYSRVVNNYTCSLILWWQPRDWCVRLRNDSATFDVELGPISFTVYKKGFYNG